MLNSSGLLVQKSRLRLLGTPSLILGEAESHQIPSKAYALIAMLVLDFHGSARRNVIAARLWEDADEENAHGNLRQLLSRIRKIESDYQIHLIVIDDTTLSLDDSCIPNDIQQLLSTDMASNAREMCDAVDLYQGEFLHGLTAQESGLQHWVAVNRRYLSDYFIHLIIDGANANKCFQSERALRWLASNFSDSHEAHDALQIYLLKHHTNKSTALNTSVPARINLEQTSRLDSMLRNEQTSPIQKNNQSTAPRIALLKPQASTELVYPHQVGIAEALVEDITLNLCRLRSIAVMAPHTTWQISSSNAINEARKLGIDYLVEFFIHSTDERLDYAGSRISMRIVEVTSMEILWAEDFEAEESVAYLRILAAEIASQLADQIDFAEIRAFRRTGDATAYRHYLEGREYMKVLNLPNLRRARKAFRHSCGLSQYFAPAMSGIARSLTLEWILRASVDRDLLLDAKNYAEKAISADPFDGSGHRELGRSSLFLGRTDVAIHHGELAERYAPHQADVLADLADTFVHNSELGKAQQRIQSALSLNPLPPDEYRWTAGGIAFLQGDYNSATQHLKKMHDIEPAWRLLAACSAMMGNRSEATAYRQKAIQVHPEFKIDEWIERVPLKDPNHLKHYVTALKSAGFV